MFRVTYNRIFFYFELKKVGRKDSFLAEKKSLLTTYYSTNVTKHIQLNWFTLLVAY